MDNLIAHFCNKMQAYPEKIAFHFYDDADKKASISFGALDAEAKKIAHALTAMTDFQDRILLIFPPGLELIKHVLGCIYAGRVAVLTYPPADKQAIIKFKHISDDAKPKIILTTAEIAKKLKQLARLNKVNKYLPLAKLFSFKKSFYKELLSLKLADCAIVAVEQLKSSDFYTAAESIQPQHLAIIQYTSGTTKEPKGVMVTHANLLNNLSLIKQCYQLTHNDVVTLWLPPYHDMGLIGGIFTTLFNGISTQLVSPLLFLKNPLFWLQLLSKYKSTITCMPNFGYEYCVRKVPDGAIKNLNFSYLRCALSGSEPIQKSVLDAFYEKFKQAGFSSKVFCPCYGLAEATLLVAGKPYEEDYKIAIYKDKKVLSTYFAEQVMQAKPIFAKGSDIFISVGRLFQEVSIINSENHTMGQEGEIGEIWVTASSSMAIGYWQKPEITGKTFQNTIADSPQKYLNTGDLGFIYQGELYICGRSKDLIIIRGKNYYPQDIEYTINHCHKLIRVGCVAVYPETLQGIEHVCVAVELKEMVSEKELEEIAQAIRYAVSLNNELHVSQVHLLAPRSIPKTTSGKLKRSAMSNLIATKQVPSYYQWCENATVTHAKSSHKVTTSTASDGIEIIENILRHLLSLPADFSFNRQQNFNELGMDSLLIVELYHAINEHYPNKNISIESFIECKSLGQVIELLNNSKQQANSEFSELEENLPKALDIFQKCTSDEGFFVSERKSNDHYYAEPILEGPCDRIMRFKGQQVLVWSLNDYLGLAGDERIKQTCIETIKKYSVAYPMGSRLLTGHTFEHEALEEQLAGFEEKEAALLCNFGYQGMIGIVNSLVGPADTVIIDNLSHSCIVDAAKVAVSKKQNLRIFKHNDMNHLNDILRQLRKQNSAGILIIVDGIYGMTGDTVPLNELVAIKEKYGARLLLDDAHGFGVMGETGRGTGEFYQRQAGIDLYFSTFAKTMAGIGGFVAGERSVIDYLKWNSKTTIFSKNLPLIYVKATEHALRIIQEEPQRLKHLKFIVQRLQRGLVELGYDIGKTQSIITPVYLNNIELDKAKYIMKLLREQYHIFVSAVTYPVIEPGKLLIRMIPTYKHTVEDVDNTLNAFRDLQKILKQICCK